MLSPLSDLVALGLNEADIRVERDVDRLRDTWPTGLKGGGHRSMQPLTVVAPRSAEIVGRILAWAATNGVRVQVQGGRSNVVGALDLDIDLVIDTGALDEIGELDPVSQTVTVGAGVLGGRLQQSLEAEGFSLGHQPQSLATSTVGGWIAMRASGAASARYGGIEGLVRGLEYVLPTGEIVSIAARPRAPGGLDAIALMCGSEGSLAVITAATLSIERRLPERRIAVSFPDLVAALDAQRNLIQSHLPVGVLRVLDAAESSAVAPPGAIEPGDCLLIASLEGVDRVLAAADDATQEIIRSSGGLALDPVVGERWWLDRYAPPGLIEGRNGDPGALFDTIEIGAMWAVVPGLATALEAALAPQVDRLWLHSSHAYPSGTCLYLAFWISAVDDDAALRRCVAVWDTTLRIADEHGATYGHHHGIGAARSDRYLAGPDGRLHRLIKAAIDPGSVLAARLLEPAATTASTGGMNG